MTRAEYSPGTSTLRLLRNPAPLVPTWHENPRRRARGESGGILERLLKQSYMLRGSCQGATVLQSRLGVMTSLP